MIDNVTLTFLPKERKDYLLYESILCKFKYKRNIIIENLDKDVKLYIFVKKKFIQIKVFHLYEFLNCSEITNKKYLEFENKLNRTIQHLNLQLSDMTITRIDYKLDLNLPQDEMQEYLYIFSKLRKKYYKLTKKIYYSNSYISNIESVYYKGLEFSLNVYDKQAQLTSRGIINSKYNGVLRIELQLKSRQLSKYCKENGLTKELINFWHRSVRQDFFNDILINKFLYTGDYYNLKNVIRQIEYMKPNLRQKIVYFLKLIAKHDITEAINAHSRFTASKYIKALESQNINPIIIKNFGRLSGIMSLLKEVDNKNSLN